jgi:hypothetical protein
MLLAGDIGGTKNDREAIAYGVPLLEPDDLHTLNEGPQIKRTLNRLLSECRKARAQDDLLNHYSNSSDNAVSLSPDNTVSMSLMDGFSHSSPS